MNIFKYELKATSKELIIYTASSILLSYISYWEYGLTDSQQMGAIFDGFPDIINIIFGISPLGLSDVLGYAALIIYYLYFIGLIYALMLGAKQIQKEIDGHTAEFLFTKPITRTKIYLEKSKVAVINLGIFVLFNWLMTVVMVVPINDPAYSSRQLVIYLGYAFFGLYLLMLMTYFITLAANLATTNKLIGLVVGFVFIFYSYGTALITLIFDRFEDLTIISPWRYFNLDIIVNEGFKLSYLSIAVVFIIIMYALGYKAIKSKSF